MARVLLIEPDPQFASVIKRYFEANEIEVDWSTNAQDAISRIDHKSPDVVILELAIPEHNGVAFLHELRSYTDWTSIPVIIYSHIPIESSGLTKAGWKKQGATDYLYKPTTRLSALRDTIESIWTIE